MDILSLDPTKFIDLNAMAQAAEALDEARAQPALVAAR